ncbi:MAG: DMT family transporter [Anaerolineae bacterium]
MPPSRRRALAEGLLVSLIWASSFVIIKIGLGLLPPLTLAGLRYFSGFLLLLPVLFSDERPPRQEALDRDTWLRLVVMGLAAYLVGNGLLFSSLRVLPATTGSFLYSFTPIMVLLLGILVLREFPSGLQLLGIGIVMLGSYVFFAVRLSLQEIQAVVAMLFSTVSFAVSGVLARDFARDDRLNSYALTAWPLCFGGGALLLVAWFVEGHPALTLPAIGVIAWLAVVNTALAYTLWNHALRTLKAFELNVLANITPLGTACMAWLMLHEPLTLRQAFGILIVLAGVSLVQWAARLN